MFPYPEIPERDGHSGEPGGWSGSGEGDEPVQRRHTDHDGRDRGDRVVNHFYGTVFYGTVDARGSTFGDGLVVPAGPDGRLRFTTGGMRDVEVQAAVSNYVRPPAFADAAARLRRDRMIVLTGEPGTGRRAGAIALLREVVDDHLLVTLSPAVTAEDLAEWDYLAEHGYLVVDGEQLGREEESDAAWELTARRVRDAGAFLVVTAGVPHQARSTALPSFRWEQPPIAEVLRGHLATNWSKDDVDCLVGALLARLPASYSLRWLASLARRVNARRDPARALREMEELCGRQVERWCDQPRSREELAAVAAGAFLAGASERTYRSWLARLDQLLVEHEPFRERPAVPGQDRTAVRHGDPATGDLGLLRIIELTSAAGPTRQVVFKEHSYARFVVPQVRRFGGAWFWQAVKTWINEVVAGPAGREVASGLAWLAQTDFDEVAGSFLEPWSRGRSGWQGRVAATYVLWWMCREETTAPLALRTAIRWAGSGDADQRATAMMAFSGELGVCYPAEAARRLWQLMSRSDDFCDDSCAALGRLFAVLVDQTREAGLMLDLLDTQRAQYCAPEGEHRLRSHTVEAILAMVTVKSNRTGRPAAVELLHTEPGRRDTLARLWAAAIHHGPTRREALIALWRTLRALPRVSEEPEPEAYALGRALAGGWPTSERAQLAAELTQLDGELRRGETALAADVLAALLDGLAMS